MLAVDVSAEPIRQVSFVVDHLPDLESDFSAVHGIRDMWTLPGPLWLRLAVRMVAYTGVMQARAQGLIDQQAASPEPVPVEGSSGPVPGDRESIESSDVLAGLIDWETD